MNAGAMKSGFAYALGVIIAVLAVVILLQQRKLAELRDINAALRGDNRALVTTRNQEGAATAELQRELRQLRAENDELRRDQDTNKGRSAVRTPE